VLQVTAAGVLANDSDPDGDALNAVLVSGTVHGTIALAADGSFLYTPAADFNGSDRFSYKAFDGELYSSAVTVSLQVQPVNDTPQAAGDSVEVVAGQTVDIAVLANDSGLGDAPLSLSAALSGSGVQPEVSGTILRYSAPSGGAGSDSFTYQVMDADGQTSSAVVSVLILASGD